MPEYHCVAVVVVNVEAMVLFNGSSLEAVVVLVEDVASKTGCGEPVRLRRENQQLLYPRGRCIGAHFAAFAMSGERVLRDVRFLRLSTMPCVVLASDERKCSACAGLRNYCLRAVCVRCSRTSRCRSPREFYSKRKFLLELMP